jgi:hypothetical protein
MATLLKVIYRFNASSIPMSLFREIENSILKLIWNQKKALNTQSNPEQKEYCWRYHNTWFQTHSNKNSMELAQKDMYTNRIKKEVLEIIPHNYHYLIFDKVARQIHWSKDSLLNTNCWENLISTCIMKLYTLFLTL